MFTSHGGLGEPHVQTCFVSEYHAQARRLGNSEKGLLGCLMGWPSGLIQQGCSYVLRQNTGAVSDGSEHNPKAGDKGRYNPPFSLHWAEWKMVGRTSPDSWTIQEMKHCLYILTFLEGSPGD